MVERSVNPNPSVVLIVGAGPTGLTAAMELSRLQIPVRLIEKTEEPATTSRAIGVQARTLELFEQRGLVEAMLEKGNRAVATSVYGEGKKTFRIEFYHNSSDHGYILIVSQAETEAILRTAVEKQGVKIERGTELVALSQSHRGDFVKAILKHRDGSLEDFNCAYLISAEGAHSICRSTLDQQFKGKTRDEDHALGDIYISGEIPGTDSHVFASDHGFLGLFPLGGARFRLVASNPISPPIKGTGPSLEELQRIYDQRSHIPARLYNLSWSSWFAINSRMVDRLRIGRVFLGGDSAHVQSPAGGQGMNTGIQDMINLAWKLAFVLKGQADPKLLDTYTDDRIPVIRDVLRNTDGLTDVIGSKSPVFRKAFSFIAPWVVGTEFVQVSSTERVSQLLLNYRGSPLSVSHGKSAARALKAGDRIPNVKVLSRGSSPGIGEVGEGGDEPKPASLFQVLDTDRFTLVLANLTDPEVTHQTAQSSLATWTPLIQTYNLSPAPGQEQPFRSVFGSQSSLILVRPDGYVAFAGTEHSLEPLATYLNTWFPARK